MRESIAESVSVSVFVAYVDLGAFTGFFAIHTQLLQHATKAINGQKIRIAKMRGHWFFMLRIIREGRAKSN